MKTAAEFSKHEYVMVLQDAKSYLQVALEHARKADGPDGLRNLNTSIWRLTQTLDQLAKAVDQLGQSPAGIRKTLSTLSVLQEKLAKV